MITLKQATPSQQQQGGGGGKGSAPPPAPVAALPPEPKTFEAAGEKPGANGEAGAAAQMVDAGRKGTKGLRIDLGSSGTATGSSGLSIPA